MHLGPAIRQFLDGYFATRDRSDKTIKAYTCDLEQYERFAGSELGLEEFDPDRIEAWAAELKRREYAPASIQRKMVSLRVFCQYWVRKGEIEDNPFWKVRLSFGRRRQLPRTLTESEMKRLLDQARRDWEDSPEDGVDAGSDESSGPDAEAAWVSPRYLALRDHALIDLLFATGIRVGEAASLTLASYSEEERAFRVAGKGGRSRMAFLVSPTSVALQALHWHTRRRLETPSDALFLNRNRTALSTQGMAGVLRKLRRRARVGRRVTPHMIRHTVATLLLRNGADLRIVQEFLGHASITSTQRYTHVTKAHLLAALAEVHPGLS